MKPRAASWRRSSMAKPLPAAPGSSAMRWSTSWCSMLSGSSIPATAASARSRSSLIPRRSICCIDVAARSGNEARKADRRRHARKDGPRRRLRPARRGLSPLFRRRALGRPALRKDALRQCRPAQELRPRLTRHWSNPEFAAVAKDIIRWMDEWLTDRERGGFYASQDADVSLDDDGDYFTWTRDEAAAVLTAEELLRRRAVFRHRRGRRYAPQP